MKSGDNLNKLLKKSRAITSIDMDHNVHNDILEIQKKSKMRTPAMLQQGSSIWRTIMQSKITKIAIAASILLAAFLSLTLFDTTVPSVYALDQTIEAYDSLRSIHITEYSIETEEPLQLVWAEFDSSGTIKNIRLCILTKQNNRIIYKDFIWKHIKEGTARLWCNNDGEIFTGEKIRIRFNIKSGTISFDKFLKHIFELTDPRRFLTKIIELESKEDAVVVIEQPDNTSEPINLTVTFAFELPIIGKRISAEIDQMTKRVLILYLFEFTNEEYHKKSLIKYKSYYQPIDPAIFEWNEKTREASIPIEDLLDKKAS